MRALPTSQDILENWDTAGGEHLGTPGDIRGHMWSAAFNLINWRDVRCHQLNSAYIKLLTCPSDKSTWLERVFYFNLEKSGIEDLEEKTR